MLLRPGKSLRKRLPTALKRLNLLFSEGEDEDEEDNEEANNVNGIQFEKMGLSQEECGVILEQEMSSRMKTLLLSPKEAKDEEEQEEVDDGPTLLGTEEKPAMVDLLRCYVSEFPEMDSATFAQTELCVFSDVRQKN